MQRDGRGTQRAALFVYGTLVKRATLEEVVGHRFDGEQYRALLRGWRRVTVTSYDYAFLVPDAAGIVDGVVLTDLTAADLSRLDSYEDLGTGAYERVAVRVEAWTCGPGDQTVDAWTYVGGAPLRALESAAG